LYSLTFIKKKGAFMRLFLCTSFFLLALFLGGCSGDQYGNFAQAQASTCPSVDYDEIAEITYIHDGDTIHLKDGRKLRLIGINTPELARDDKPAEAYAVHAKQALESLFSNDSSLSLVYGKDDRDRYGRLLAHAFSSDGENVQLALLNQGYALAINFPPNTRFSDCYLEAETRARCNKVGMWQSSRILDAKDLTREQSGFQLVNGEVKSIKTNKKGIWLNLDDRLTIGIRSEDLTQFDLEKIQGYLNTSLTVRGWVNKSKHTNPFYIRVRHPASLQSPSSISCNR
jgi:endonuclease YncB( thermonuclease family)